MAISSTATLSPIAVLDKHGDIVGVNQAWETFGDQNGLPEAYTSVGKNYVTIAQQADNTYGSRVVAELRHLLTDDQARFMAIYPCHSPNQERWFRLYGSAVSLGGDRYYVLVHQRLDQDPPSKSTSLSDVVETPTKRVDYRDRSRLVTYSLSSDESATEGILVAFDAVGIDTQNQDTTLQDWIDSDVINALQTGIPEFHITFHVWNYPVGLTPEKVILYTLERDSE